MAIEQYVQVDGMEALFKRMDELRDEVGKGKTDKIWRNCLQYAFEPVLQDAKTFAPSDTGQLADHIYMKVRKPRGFDKSSETYQGEMYLALINAGSLRDDSKLHTILNKKGKFQNVWRNTKPVAVSQEFGNAATPAHPFLRPALMNNIENVQTRLAQALMVQISKIAEKK
jgi:HK97 gp10 family phage protein